MSERLVFGYGTSGHSGQAPVRMSASAPAAPVHPNLPPGVPVRVARERMDWAFKGLLFFTVVLYLRPQDTIRPLALIPLAEIFAVTALIAMMSKRLRSGLAITRVTPELLGVAGIGAVMLITAPFSIWPGGVVSTFFDLYLKIIVIFVLMLNTLTSPKRVHQFTAVLVSGTSYIAFRAVFDYARGFNLVENGRVQGSVGGMFQNPNDLALNMVSVLPLAVLLAIWGKSSLGRLAAVAGAFLMIGATVVSQSRSGFLGLAAMLLFVSVLLGKKRPGLVAAGVLAVLMALPFAPSSYWERVLSITDNSKDATGSREARRILLDEGWAAFLSDPLTGVGAGQFKNYNPKARVEAWRETHNVVLQVASETGIAGLAAFLYLVYRAAVAGRHTRRLLRRAVGGLPKRRWGQPQPEMPALITAQEGEFLGAHAAAMTAAIAGWFLSALFASVAYNWTFYYLLALAIAPREILADRISIADTAAARIQAGGAALREARA